MSLARVSEEWDRCRAWLVPALGRDTEAAIVWELMSGRAQLWRGDRSALVTQLVAGEPPYILLWLAGGDLQEILAMDRGVTAWARAQGAREARINGRKGWARALKRLGFEPDGDELRKAI